MIKVVCGVLMKDDRFLITQKGDQKNYGLWEFPGGKVKTNETPFESIFREIKEELGIEVLPKNEIISYEHDIYTLIFIKCIIKNQNENIVLNEHLDYKWVYQTEIKKFNFIDGDIEFINNITNFII